MMPVAGQRNERGEEIGKTMWTQNAPTAKRFRCACVCSSIERCKSSPGIAFSSP